MSPWAASLWARCLMESTGSTTSDPKIGTGSLAGPPTHHQPRTKYSELVRAKSSTSLTRTRLKVPPSTLFPLSLPSTTSSQCHYPRQLSKNRSDSTNPHTNCCNQQVERFQSNSLWKNLSAIRIKDRQRSLMWTKVAWVGQEYLLWMGKIHNHLTRWPLNCLMRTAICPPMRLICSCAGQTLLNLTPIARSLSTRTKFGKKTWAKTLLMSYVAVAKSKIVVILQMACMKVDSLLEQIQRLWATSLPWVDL